MAYIDYIDEMVVDSFFNIIQCSIKFLMENTTPRPEPEPLFEACLELNVRSFILNLPHETLLTA